ncbi:SLC13 family permease [Kocuria rhizophila]|uniref:SLC13 family permease n=1 Tax=Kocuria rhizophila TaxID=72000 RepID=UPI001CB909BB|nr:DASS family sodium-coupled anion symporter [Kocuria rhizophila]MCG7423805.1 DASS family sodium-coupled anion symporter [Kocuria rhizophila]MCT1957707.1 DASS family sodium-coupled anion symporter [Kocuria rhizophila]MCT2073443.1 DASS family sodium-coupled anion symporter [Kocuria rhizophila]MCT2249591.1 DASS family sodium-coupled anion symporter [Kocuria rhizophila]WSY88216.1 DASS family sodium-coupled anion symporter [Kocuria rhizophila]
MSHPAVPGAHLKNLDPDPHRGEEVNFQSPGERAPAEKPHTRTIRLLGLLAGLTLAAAIYALMPQDVPHNAKLTAATAVLMGVWWMTEALPLPATALIPLVVFPTLGEDITLDKVGASYGNNIIFLFMGGFLLALAMQRWNLHRRIALLTVKVMGTKPSQMVAGFMVATGFLSMWVSNTATAVMMLPIGVSVLLLVTKIGSGDGETAPATAEAGGSRDTGEVDLQDDQLKEEVVKSNFGTALMLGIAYSASIGSLGTIIGTPPNTLMAGYLSDAHDITIGFGQWMLVGVPLAVVLMALCWLLLTKVLFKPEISEIPGGKELIGEELHKLGPMSSGEKRVLALFVLAAAAWILVPILFDDPMISDAGIAVAVGLLLFLCPAGAAPGVRLLDWETAVKLPWGVLLLFGGGLALSAQFSTSGLTEWIGQQVQGLGGLPVVLLVLLMAGGILLLTELTSNTATAATFLPVAGGVAMGIGVDPMLLAIPVALAATCAFMLPVATPPNAIAFGSGYVTVSQMIRGGVWLNLIALVLITITTMTLGVWVFGLTF